MHREPPPVTSTPVDYERDVKKFEVWTNGRLSWPVIFHYEILCYPGSDKFATSVYPPSLDNPTDINPNGRERKQTWDYRRHVNLPALYDCIVALGYDKLPAHTGAVFVETLDNRKAPQ